MGTLAIRTSLDVGSEELVKEPVTSEDSSPTFNITRLNEHPLLG